MFIAACEVKQSLKFQKHPKMLFTFEFPHNTRTPPDCNF